MIRTWHYQRQGTAVGPISEQEIRHLVSLGKISSRNLVWNKELSDWTPLVETDLANDLPVAPPPIVNPTAEATDTLREKRSLWERLLHGFLWLMIFWAGTNLFVSIFLMFGRQPSSATFNFAALFTGGGLAQIFAGSLWSLPKLRRVRLSLFITAILLLLFFAQRFAK